MSGKRSALLQAHTSGPGSLPSGYRSNIRLHPIFQNFRSSFTSNHGKPESREISLFTSSILDRAVKDNPPSLNDKVLLELQGRSRGLSFCSISMFSHRLRCLKETECSQIPRYAKSRQVQSGRALLSGGGVIPLTPLYSAKKDPQPTENLKTAADICKCFQESSWG